MNGEETLPLAGQRLSVEVGQCSQAGVRQHNEDCCGVRVPEGMELIHKGIVAVTADGVGSGEAGREASEYCVQGFIADYLSTPLSWSVETSGMRILRALNSWLYSQGQRRFASEQSMASTMAALILKSTTAHLFHVGDSRIYLIRGGNIRRLTQDHRIIAERNKSFLSRAMGGEPRVHPDYRTLPVEADDLFLLCSDGVHDTLGDAQILATIQAGDGNLENMAEAIVEAALAAGSRDNVTCQLVRVTRLPDQDEHEYYRRLTELPFPPPLTPGMELDGYRIIETLHASATIQVYLAEDIESGEKVAIKTPSINFEDDPAYIDRFLHEVWVGRRIDNPHVFKVHHLKRPRSYIYYVTEFLEGRSLAQWILDHPRPELDEVRRIAAQIIKGLRAFHRKEMVHRDIKPENIMIDRNNTVKIIDFGTTQVAGLREIHTPIEQPEQAVGTTNYIAPELFDGFEATPKSDQFSLGVTLYAMLSGGALPYGAQREDGRPRHRDYIPLRRHNPDVPVWMDGAIRRAVHFNPEKRYESLSEFEHDLNTPNPELMKTAAPLIERDPVTFWRGLAVALLVINLTLLYLLAR